MKKSMLLGILMVSVFLMSGVSAQESYNNVVTAGNTTEVEIGTDDTQPSALLGGLISRIMANVERFVDFGGIKVWKDVTGTGQEMVFDLFMFDVGDAINLNGLATGSVYETSEPVTVGACTDCVWETLEATSTDYTEEGDFGPVDYAVLQADAIALPTSPGADLMVIFDDSDELTLTAMWVNTGNTSLYGYAAEYNTGSFEGPSTAVYGTTPSEAVLSSLYGGVVTEIQRGEVGGITEYILFFQLDGVRGWIADINKDGYFDNTEIFNGYNVVANAGETLAILPGGSYDLYIILPA